MNNIVPTMLFCWPLVVLVLFAVMPARRAVIISFIFAWLFLPIAGYQFAGLPNYTKISATCYGVVLGIILFDPQRLMQFRPHWIDVPMAVLCLVPMASSLSNGLGAYDGMSGIVTQAVTWGIPYLVGRLYFNDLLGLRELAIGIFVGGLVYVPFCLVEMRMSPQLHNWVYGFHQHSFGQSRRFGGFRPTVFMQHGLAVALWMGIASLVGVWLWMTGAVRGLRRLPMSWLVPVLLITTVMCRSAGALALLAIGLAALLVTRATNSRLALVAVALLPLLYMGSRITGWWDGRLLIETAHLVVADPRRVDSLSARIHQENVLGQHAWRQPVFGWGDWGRNRPSTLGYSDEKVVTDGLWMIIFGTRGLVGLAGFVGLVMAPVLLMLLKVPTLGWLHAACAPAAALSMILVIYLLDSLFNAMINPIYLLAAGGLGGWLAIRPMLKQRTVLRDSDLQPIQRLPALRSIP